jgi:phage tail sheath protein FI
MPVNPTYPGIYIQEAPSTSHTITGAPTNVAVIIGYSHPLKTNPANFGVPVEIFGFMDYQRQFGGFVRSAAFANAAAAFGDLAVAVNQFFINGGTDAWVVALNNSNLPQQGSQVSFGSIVFTALEITDEVYQMTITVRPSGVPISPPLDDLADVIITYGPVSSAAGVPKPPSVTETYRRVSTNPFEDDGVTPNPNFIEARIGTPDNPVSQLVTVSAGSPPGLLPITTAPAQNFVPSLSRSMANSIFEATDFTAVLQQDTGLDKLPVFNLMVIPGVTSALVLNEALAFCELKRAFFIMDPPIADSADGTVRGFPHRIQDSANDVAMPRSKNGALYFPYLKSPDPVTGLATNALTGAANEIPPSATVAGVFAATDVSRGVWKAPAGFQATTANTLGVVDRGQMTDNRQGVLNLIGVNCLRDFPNIGTAVFGARTLVTASDEQWRYVPVRRMALFLEQTFYANLKWVVFEPNAEPLWTAITMSINAFMLGLFRQNAFKGTKPSEAFQVLCNSQTTTPADIDNGVVNIVVAFAPLKPAEFVVITIAQLAGQTQSS